MQLLQAEQRNIQDNSVKTLREKGLLPCVVYGPKTENKSLAIALKDFEKVYKSAGETSLITLQAGDKKLNVLIYDVQHDPVTLRPIHADFYAVDMKKALHAKVPLVFTGESAAVKNEGAILLKVMQEIEVEALPEDLPHEISVSIEALAAIGDRITVSALHLPKGVKIKSLADDVVALVEAPRAEEEVIAPVAEEGVVEVKTEKEIKAAEKEAKEKEEAATTA